MRAVLATAVLCGACVTAQPARVLPCGKTAVSVGGGRVTTAVIPGEDEARPRWFGQLVVRRGLGRRMDAAVIAARTVGSQGAVSALAVEPRLQVLDRGRAALALGVTVGVGGSEFVVPSEVDQRRVTRFEGYLLATSATLGLELAPRVELVLAPRAYLLVPARSSAEVEPGLGAAVGLRVVDDAGTWAIQPELAFAHTDGDTLITAGLSVSVGD